MSRRIILHVDMDYFFAQIEERENPSLKGKPVVVGSDPKNGAGRGVVSTANYEARKFGIRSAMSIARAFHLCPQAIFLPVNYDLYEKVSEKIMQIMKKFSTKMEPVSLDEAYLDISGVVSTYDDARELAEKIRNEILRKERLTCSIGIGPNKLVAKLASDFRKPFGLTVVRPEEVIKFISPMRIRRLLGVGPKTEKILNNMGVRRVGDLEKVHLWKLVEKFGKRGIQLHEYSRGIDNEEVVEFWESKSFGREITFEEDTNDENVIFKAIDNLSLETHQDLVKNDFSFKTVLIKVRYENFETHTRARTLKFPTIDLQTMVKVSKELAKFFLNSNRNIRLIGVRVSGLVKRTEQKTLFEDSMLSA